MKTIWKYPLRFDDYQCVIMPADSAVLTVQLQDGTPTLWAEVDTRNVLHTLGILMYGTGNPLPANPGRYIATVQDNRGLVQHFYEA